MRPVMLPLVLAASLLAGCANGPTNKQIGTGIGAVGGGLIGSLFGAGMGKVVATAAGGLIGGWLGNAAGGALDDADKKKATEAVGEAEAAQVGETISWANPDSGNSGTTKVTGESLDEAGNRCRNFQSTVSAGGKDEIAHGTACRQPDGSWAAVR